MMGPGVRITHSAVSLLAESGSTAVWVGENGVRYYAHGSPPARSSRLLEAQAAAVSDPKRRLAVAREMYRMRFPGEEISGLSLQQLRGREGARVRRLYRTNSKKTGVEWDGREYDKEDFASGTVVNQALSAANSAVYGVVHAVIVALGCSPGLGFIHTGHYRSFVYDMADLYKADLSIPVAFEVAARSLDVGVGTAARQLVRDRIREGGVVAQCVRDIKRLLADAEDEDDSEEYLLIDEIRLWDDLEGSVRAGISYSGGGVNSP